MDDLVEDVDEELDMTNDSEALLQSNQSTNRLSVLVDGDTSDDSITVETIGGIQAHVYKLII